MVCTLICDLFLGNIANAAMNEKPTVSIMKMIDEQLKQVEANRVYQNLTANNEAVTTTINKKTVQNRRNEVLQHLRLSHDEMYSLYLIGSQFPNAVHRLIHLPKLIVVFGNNEMIVIFNKLLLSSREKIIL
ncbi:unnamed protein product [Didymodactylos carnosus]|uniref:Uncharacterized protein n=1 Tax=Didymodactylos carnosus TaxID=1234261 RepID=A0A815BJV9_9BILA|nr:unnamed protein product [Didymodactylos carnosus]CAF1271591.1 unnamed protein product [Didymodactylos carnosus]CAF3729959.1 unnamed protein product [Didymodactylos carnosus]CAF4059952.1 unnamed protein product [Didymodactylos carnosus]